MVIAGDLCLCMLLVASIALIATAKEFYWGTATASFQIEGAVHKDGRGMTIWDTFQQLAGAIDKGDVADVADDSYHKYKEDVALMKAMGVNSYRFSIAWSRILPTGTKQSNASDNEGVNELGVHYYNNLIDLLLENDIEPFVTLYHWDLPQALEDRYNGFLSTEIIKDFVAYADICFQLFGDRVKRWITLNEPWTVAYMGYELGVHAPGRCSNRSKCSAGNSSTESYIVAHNMLNAHAAVVNLYRQKYHQYNKRIPARFPQRVEVQGLIGITLNHDWAAPYTDSAADHAAAERRNEFQMGWFADPIFFGKYPDSMVANVGTRLPKFSAEERSLLIGSIDFLGLNHYSSKYHANYNTKKTGWSFDQQAFMTPYNSNGDLIGPLGESSWMNVVPWGFHRVLKWSHRRYMKSMSLIDAGRPVPIYVTENGVDVPNESNLPIHQLLQDDFRINYYRSYLAAMMQAINEGVDIRGYFAWSLLDNFEWANGFDKRFGLHYVDFNNPSRPRIPKSSAQFYEEYIQQHPDPKMESETNYHHMDKKTTPTCLQRILETSEEKSIIKGDEMCGWWDFIEGAIKNAASSSESWIRSPLIPFL